MASQQENHPRTKSMVGGMTVLGLAGIICKLIGVLFTIPLTRLIGANGLGIYQAVYPTYNLLLTISSAGLPVAVSRLVSACLARRDPRNAKRTFVTAAVLMTAIGVCFSILMFLSSGYLARRVNQPESLAGFRMIAPCVALVCLLAAFRGFMQGQQDMVPTAISQLIEQVGKVVIALPLAAIGVKTSVALGAAYALLGITIVEGVALLYIILLYLRRRARFGALPQESTDPLLSRSQTARELILISIPITLSACIVPLASFVDSAMLVNRMLAAGLTLEEARPLYGLFSGLVIRLINIPTALALSISMSLVPAVSSARAVGDTKMVQNQCDLGLRFAFLIGFPCSLGMSLLSKEIVAFFYSGSLTAQEMESAASLLSVSSLTVVLFTVVQATSAILQGLQYQKIPMYTLVAGVVCKIALNYVLVGTPGIHIHGGPIASLVCYTVSMVPNLIFVIKKTGMRFQWKSWVLKPGGAALIMFLLTMALKHVLPLSHLTTILEIAFGVAVYLAAAFLLGAMTKEDLKSFTRGFHRKKGKA
ncbi:MAG: polysaccharide biosynthesis protein [Clostridia bacterium]|nr:polysaccharide biosynthesis protein [Clostridia bacterium]